MTNSRRKFTAEQKAAIVWRNLKGKESISLGPAKLYELLRDDEI